jgi:benzoyl-CoA 2,3-dioxygenase component A
MLFFGARTQEELPYFGPLQNPAQGLHRHQLRLLAHARASPKRYVQDVMRERAADLAPLLQDPNAYFYVCGLKAMEEGVVLALRDMAQQRRPELGQRSAPALKREGRLHLETY